MKLGCIVMAAGSSSRFGGNKLLAVVEGETLFERALRCIPRARFEKICAVCGPGTLPLARAQGVDCVLNDRPELGASHTIRLGLDAVGEVDGAMFLVSDQPWLEKQSVEKLLDLFEADTSRIAALSHGGRRGNPCVFPRVFFPQLRALEGDHGGSSVIARSPQRLVTLDIPARQLRDVDFRSDLE